MCASDINTMEAQRHIDGFHTSAVPFVVKLPPMLNAYIQNIIQTTRQRQSMGKRMNAFHILARSLSHSPSDFRLAMNYTKIVATRRSHHSPKIFYPHSAALPFSLSLPFSFPKELRYVCVCGRRMRILLALNMNGHAMRKV